MARNDHNGHKRNTLTPTQYRELQHSFAARLAHDPEITLAFMKVGMAYLLHINSETGAAWPNTETITRLTGVSTSTVTRARKYYGLKGHMTLEARPGTSPMCYPHPRQQDDETPTTDPCQQDDETGGSTR